MEAATLAAGGTLGRPGGAAAFGWPLASQTKGGGRGQRPLPPPLGAQRAPAAAPPAPRPPALALGTDHLGAAMPAGKKNKKEH